MKDLVNVKETMSSRVIANLTGKQHQHVKRDIEKMLKDLNIDASIFGHNYLDSMNRTQIEYKLPKRETLILASGYNTVLRAKIIDRWLDLEINTSIQPTKLTRKQLAYMVIEAEEKAERLQL